MSYIGHNPTNAGSFYILDDITLGNSTGPYNLTVAGVSVTPKIDNLLIALDGVLQHAEDAYTISGNQITFDAAPGSGVDFYGVIMGQSASFAQGSIGADELRVDGDGTSLQVLASDGDGTFSWISQSALTPSANLVTGATLKSTVTASSLTSVGTLSSLATSGNVGVGSATTSSPSSASRTLRIQHASGSASLVLCGDNDNETAWDILANTSGQLDIRKNNSSKLLVEADGTVVMSGALQPAGNVTISGNARIGGTSLTPSGDKDQLVVESTNHGGMSALGPDNKEQGFFTGHASSNRVGEFHTRYDTNVLTIGSAKASMQVLFMSGNRQTALTLGGDQSATFAANVQVTDRVYGQTNLILSTADSNEKIHMDGSGYIKIETDGSERVRINDSGNFGINETDPNTKLHATGRNSYTTANLGEVSGLGFVRFQPTGTSEDSLWIHNGGGYLGLQASTNADSSTADNITLNAYGGRVGIGTAGETLHAKLHIIEGVNGQEAIFINNTVSGGQAMLVF